MTVRRRAFSFATRWSPCRPTSRRVHSVVTMGDVVCMHAVCIRTAAPCAQLTGPHAAAVQQTPVTGFTAAGARTVRRSMMPFARSTCAALSLSRASAAAVAALRSSARLFACFSAACANDRVAVDWRDLSNA